MKNALGLNALQFFLVFITVKFSVLLWKIKIYQQQPQKVFFKKGVLRNFAKLTGKRLCQSLFFNKVAGRRNSCELCEISKNTSERLLLSAHSLHFCQTMYRLRKTKLWKVDNLFQECSYLMILITDWSSNSSTYLDSPQLM